MMSCDEFTSLISYVRIGACAGLLDVPVEKLTYLLVKMQPATINADAGEKYTSAQRDVIRADAVKKALE